jgi:Sigma-70 region 2
MLQLDLPRISIPTLQHLFLESFATPFPRKNVERALLNASKGGNSKAFGELLAHYERRLQSLANEIARNRDDAQEVVQNALLSAILRAHSFRGRAGFPLG